MLSAQNGSYLPIDGSQIRSKIISFLKVDLTRLMKKLFANIVVIDNSERSSYPLTFKYYTSSCKQYHDLEMLDSYLPTFAFCIYLQNKISTTDERTY